MTDEEAREHLEKWRGAGYTIESGNPDGDDNRFTIVMSKDHRHYHSTGATRAEALDCLIEKYPELEEGL